MTVDDLIRSLPVGDYDLAALLAMVDAEGASR